MTIRDGLEVAKRLAELDRAFPDSFASRDERAAWFEKKAELYEEIASSGVSNMELATQLAAEAQQAAVELRCGKRGVPDAVAESGS